MATYASSTKVSPQKSREEIEVMLIKYGATAFGYSSTPEKAAIQFDITQRRYRLMLALPLRHDFRTLPLYQQAIRQVWRALALVIKAKLVAVEQGIAALDDEFLAYLVLPDGRSMSDAMRPQIADMYTNRRMPSLLPERTGE